MSERGLMDEDQESKSTFKTDESLAESDQKMLTEEQMKKECDADLEGMSETERARKITAFVR